MTVLPNHTVRMPVTRTFERALEQLVKNLSISDTHYEAAERSYQSVARWLNRPESRVAKLAPSIYSQGSFKLGTVIRPPTDEDCFDLDIVCEMNASKATTTQEHLKEALGKELDAYAKDRRMQEIEPGQYCWTLHYADSAQFRMDVLPAIPDAADQRLLLEAQRLHNEWVSTAIGLTNTAHPQYRSICCEWPVSNPQGYSQWFRSKMQIAFNARRRAIALAEGKADVEKIPEHRVKTPLQESIQILKRHRDGAFSDRPDVKPASIVINTLAAHAYGQEETLSGALFSILTRMDQFIETRDGTWWIPNPTDTRENFADRWRQEPALREAFYEWLAAARSDFRAAATLSDDDAITEQLAPRMGRALLERTSTHATSRSVSSRRSTALSRILSAAHRQAPSWPVLSQNAARVQIRKVKVARKGFRTASIGSNGAALEKRCDLKFEAETDVTWPYDVYWQVVNTGTAARNAGCLRGTFELSHVDRGHLTRRESTLYSGTHSIECFIVKNGFCVAQSGPFIVNVK